MEILCVLHLSFEWLGIYNMDLDTANSIEVITVSTSSSPGSSGKKVVPLQIGFEKFPLIENVEIGKLRRPVRPIDRQRMRPWLMELLDLGNVFGLRWTNRNQGVFQISWRHASRLGWNLETDGDVFERWARHTGIYREGDPPEPKRWKANFRCALHSLHDVVELTSAVERKGRNACRTYRFLHSSDQQSLFRKKAKSRKVKEQPEKSYEKNSGDKPPIPPLDSASSEDCVSESESEWSPEDKVIVQELNLKTDIPEEYGLHHDHDYSVGPDKTQKTIVLRQGIGSIVLHKEILSAPDEGESDQNILISNLDQLASAAMSSAGINESQADRKGDKKLAMQESEESSDSPDFNISDMKLKNLLSDKIQTAGYMTRKRKTVPQEETKLVASSASSSSRKISKRKSVNITSDVKNNSSSSLPSIPVARPRSASPKILCRRSKRHLAKSEKCLDAAETSESTEPLMSSCLLLLEAATRLDNAEKNGRSASQHGNSTDVEMVETVKTSSQNTFKVDINSPSSKIHHFVINQDNLQSASRNVNIFSNKATVQNVLIEPALIRPESKNIVSEAKGLFSGSNIHSSIHSVDNNVPATVTLKRKNNDAVKIQPVKSNYYVVATTKDVDTTEIVNVSGSLIKPNVQKHVIVQSNVPIVKRNVKSDLDKQLMSVDDKSQAGLLEGNVYSVITPHNGSDSVCQSSSPKVLVASPASANVFGLSSMNNLVTSPPLSESTDHCPTLMVYELGKDTFKDLKVQLLPVSGTSDGHSHVIISTSTGPQGSTFSSPTSVSSKNTKWQLEHLLSSVGRAKTKDLSTQHQTMSSVPQIQLVSVAMTNEEKVQPLPLYIESKSFNEIDSNQQVFLVRTVGEDGIKKEVHCELDMSHVTPNQLVSIKDQQPENNRENSELSLAYDSVYSSSLSVEAQQHLKFDDSIHKCISQDPVKSLSELCKPYLSHLFSALDNQSSESDDSDSVGDSSRLDQSQSSVANAPESLSSDKLSDTDTVSIKTEVDLINLPDISVNDDLVSCEAPVVSPVDESHQSNSLTNTNVENIPLLTSIKDEFI